MSESRAQNTYLLIPIVLLSILASTAAIRGPSILSLSGFGSAIIVAAPLILATYALMSVAIAGRGTVDLAVGPLLAFINVSLVTLNGLGLVTSPIAVFIVALGIGIIYQVLFALAIIVVRVQPIIVALSGFLALSGINRIILPRPGGVAPEWMASWGLGNTIFSPILLILILATAGWLLFTLSPFYKHLRAMGYDERAAFTSGVRINLVRVGAHIIAGVFVGLGAICYTALIASGDPTQGTTMSLTAVTAVVLGGVEPVRWARQRHRRAAWSHQPLSHRLRSGDVQFRRRAGIRDPALLRSHPHPVVAVDPARSHHRPLHLFYFAFRRLHGSWRDRRRHHAPGEHGWILHHCAAERRIELGSGRRPPDPFLHPAADIRSSGLVACRFTLVTCSAPDGRHPSAYDLVVPHDGRRSDFTTVRRFSGMSSREGSSSCC